MGFWANRKKRSRVEALKTKARGLRATALEIWQQSRVFSPKSQDAAEVVWTRLEQEAFALWSEAAELEINAEAE